MGVYKNEFNGTKNSSHENDTSKSNGVVQNHMTSVTDNSGPETLPMNQLSSRFETYINRNLTMDDIESFRESCPVKVVTHGVMGMWNHDIPY